MHESFQSKENNGPRVLGVIKKKTSRGSPLTTIAHVSTTDPDARVYKKSEGTASKLCHMNHLMMENRNGLVVDVSTTEANGKAER